MLKVLRHILSHPLNKGAPVNAVMRFIRWQLASRLMPYPQMVPFVNGTVLVMERGMTGATGNWYSGLHEHGDMGFVLHVLRPEDLFADIGANIGSYTVLASGAVGAHTICFEPLPDTFHKLERNVAANRMASVVECHNVGVGSEEGMVTFTAGLDTTNHVVADAQAYGGDTVQVPVRPLDDVLQGRVPRIAKIDVEGWEPEVLAGMPETLAHPDLVAIIAETNDSDRRYGGDRRVLDMMQQAGFAPYSYDPFQRALTPGGTTHNTVFVRDVGFVEDRIAGAPTYRLINRAL